MTDLTITTPPALLVVGHGTKDAAGAEEFRQLVARAGTLLAARGVTAAGGFIELAPPPLADTMADLVAAGHRTFAAVPLMLVAAGHAKGDIPAALAREKARHPGITVAYGRPLGPHPALLDALTQRLDAVLDVADRPHTTVVLVGRGSTDPDANAEIAKVARLLFEGRGLAGVEPAYISLADPGVPAALERCRRLGAERIVVLPYFLFGGVLPDRIVAQTGEWAAAHPGVPVTVAGLIGDCDELAGIVVERYAEALAGDIRMNCDTCLYRVALPGFADRVGAPQRPHDHPDDPAGHHHHHAHAH
ncbi:MAG TPA: sirohydrochlorin chelatase [Mycobacteriales bacterium]|nr:sirohydrochlorin chelatase [Mycobacterium sp.]